MEQQVQPSVLYQVIRQFADIDLPPNVVANIEMRLWSFVQVGGEPLDDVSLVRLTHGVAALVAKFAIAGVRGNLDPKARTGLVRVSDHHVREDGTMPDDVKAPLHGAESDRAEVEAIAVVMLAIVAGVRAELAVIIGELAGRVGVREAR